MKNYLYAVDTDSSVSVDASGDAILFPASNITLIQPKSTTTTQIDFKAGDGTNDTDHIVFTHAAGKFREFCNALVKLINTRRKDGFTVLSRNGVTDGAIGVGVDHSPINDLDSTILVTDVDITIS